MKHEVFEIRSKCTGGKKCASTMCFSWWSWTFYSCTQCSYAPEKSVENYRSDFEAIQKDADWVAKEIEWREKDKVSYKQKAQDAWKTKCSVWENIASVIVALANAIYAAVKAIVEALISFIKEFGCMIVEVGLSIVGAILDGIIMAAMTVGSGGSFVLNPMYILFCGNKAAKAGAPFTANRKVSKKGFGDSEITQYYDVPNYSNTKNIMGNSKTIAKSKTSDSLGDFAQTTAEAMPSRIEACETNECREEKTDETEANVEKSMKSVEKMVTLYKPKKKGGLLEIYSDSMDNSNSSAVATVGSEVGFANEILKEFIGMLFTLFNSIASMVMSEEQAKEVKAAGDTIEWILMRMWEAFCGEFASVLLAFVKEAALCNMCTLDCSCTLSFMQAAPCQAYCSSWEAKDKDAQCATWVGPKPEEDSPYKTENAYVDGNNGNEYCEQYCIRNGFQNGRVGGAEQILTTYNVFTGLKDQHKVLLSNDASSHFAKSGSSPADPIYSSCCPAHKAISATGWGQGVRVCTHCNCEA